MSTMLEWAKYYRDTMGWSVIPIVKGAKNPSIPWTEYQTRKATDEELNKWFKNDNANIGVVTGKISNIAVVDIDTEEGMQEITKYIPDSTITPTVSTPKGGQHLYFTMPDIDLRNNTRAVPGCDLRAEGGYVVAPPSINGNGKAYHWVIDTNTSISYLNHAYIYYILASTTFSMSPIRFDGQSDHKVTTNRPQSDHTDLIYFLVRSIHASLVSLVVEQNRVHQVAIGYKPSKLISIPQVFPERFNVTGR